MFKAYYSLLKNIHRNGLSESDDALTTLRVILTNLTVLSSTVLLLIYSPICIKNSLWGPFTVFGIAILGLLMTYYLNRIRKFKAASILVFLTSAITICISIMTFGTSGESQSLIPILMIFVFILFDKPIEWIIFGTITVLCFLVPYLYIDLLDPVVIPPAIPYDYYLNLGFSILSCALLSFFVMKSVKHYMAQQKSDLEELKKKNLVINKQNEEMELFTTMASHDLKTPVRTINSFLGLLEKSASIKSPEALEYLKIAKSGVTQLNDLINGISKFRKLDEDVKPGKYEKTTLIFNQVKATVNPANDENIIISAEALADLKILPAHLYHIFQNLIENGIKYNDKLVKKITLSQVLKNDKVQIIVQDNGIGIDENYLEHIFEPFKKLHSSDKYHGTGLGLSICKKIIEMYDGTIIAECNGQGSKFILSFPLTLINS